LILDDATLQPQAFFQFWSERGDCLVRSNAKGLLAAPVTAGIDREASQEVQIVSLQPGFLVQRVQPQLDRNGRRVVLVRRAALLKGIVRNIPEALQSGHELFVDLDYGKTLADGAVRRAIYKSTTFPPVRVRPDGGFEIPHRHAVPAFARLSATESRSRQRYHIAEVAVDSGQEWAEFDLSGVHWTSDYADLELELVFEGMQPQGQLSWELIDESGQKVRGGYVDRPPDRSGVSLLLQGLQEGRHHFDLRSPFFGSVGLAQPAVHAPKTAERVVVPLGGSLRVDVTGVDGKCPGRWDLMLLIMRLDGSLVGSAYPAQAGGVSIEKDYIVPGRYFARARATKLRLVSPTLLFDVAAAQSVHLVTDLRPEHQLNVRLGEKALPLAVEVRDPGGELVDAARTPYPRDSYSFWLTDGVYDVLRTDSSKPPVRVRIDGEDVSLDLAR